MRSGSRRFSRPGTVPARQPKSYSALDLALEGSLLAGITGGYVCGWFAGMMIAIPSMFHGELCRCRFWRLSGSAAACCAMRLPTKKTSGASRPFQTPISPASFSIGRELRSALFHLFFTFAVIATEFLRQVLGRRFEGNGCSRLPAGTIRRFCLAAVYASTYFCVTIPLKVWNNTRNEVKLEEQERLLIQARLEALASQINPHFLFNTLNSISSLIRINPEQARLMVMRLARIMRGRLRSQDHFAPLRDELAFIEDYLSIELVRFGDKLSVVKHIDPATLDMLVPSMLLQPLIENSIKHGISSKVDGGTVTIRASHE